MEALSGEGSGQLLTRKRITLTTWQKIALRAKNMGTITVIGLLILSCILFVLVRKGWIDNQTLQNLANIAAIVALVAAVLIFIIPAATRPEPDPNATPNGVTPSPVVTTVSAPDPRIYTVAISEVMANPCGKSDGTEAVWNEYIELYNYGNRPVDVSGWWISDGEVNLGNPDQIVSWGTRHPRVSLGDTVEMNSTIIPPSGYAVILPAIYHQGEGAYKMPYIFPDGAILLTISEGTLLGSDDYGLEVLEFRNTVTLYEGTENIISKIISTYGTPKLSSSPHNLPDDGLDRLPFFLPDCYSAERIEPSEVDSEDNWRMIKEGTPGFGPYIPHGNGNS
jgi:hypothetical protein